MNLNHSLSTLLILAGSLFLSATAMAGVEHGKKLHDNNCISCHASMLGGDGTGIYVRENKKIESHPALVKQVNRCRDSLGIEWPEEHVNDVVEYLNTNFYKYEK